MELKDLLIMEVPRNALKFITESYSLKPEKNTAEAYAEIISNSPVTQDTANLLVQGYRYAGRTAVNIYRPYGNSFNGEWDDEGYFHDRMVSLYGSTILEMGQQPQLTDTPKLIRIERHGSTSLLVFSYLGKPRRVLENYEIIRRRPQLIDFVLVRFNPFIIEIRAHSQDTNKFKKALLDTMGIVIEPITGDICWEHLTRLTEEEIGKLSIDLHASLRGAKHKMVEGIYSTKEVTASPNIPDLKEEQEYLEEFRGIPYRKWVFSFNFCHNYGLQEEISYQITDQGLNFIKPVSEEVISYVVDKIIEMRRQS